MAQPVVKWAGGKRWAVETLVPKIRAKLAETNGSYLEPFLGGGALAFGLGLPGERLILNDICTPLMHTYEVIRDSPGALAWTLTNLWRKGTDEASYYLVRESMPTVPVQAAARFLYLNRLGFNGLYRVNKSGKFNVPWGKKVDPKPFSHDAFLDLSLALRGATLLSRDFSACLLKAKSGDVVFSDPPYDISGHKAYDESGFNEKDQRVLASTLHELFKMGVHSISTNADTPLIREIYGSWAKSVEPVIERRSINSDGAGRSGDRCLIISTW